MTLVIAAKYRDNVLCGADGQVTIDPYGMKREYAKKLFKATDYVCILLYGTLEIGNYVIEKYIRKIRNRAKGVTYIANDLSNFCKQEIAQQLRPFRNFLSLSPLDLFSFEKIGFGVIVAGLDKQRNRFKPEIYVLESDSLFAPQQPQQNYVVRGKWILADHMFNREFKNPDRVITLPKLTDLLLSAIHETSEVDIHVGRPSQLVLIDSRGCHYKDNDIEEFYEKMEEQEEL